MTLLLAHVLILATASYVLAGRLVRHRADRLVAAALLGWTHIVLLSLGLSACDRLGDAAGYFRGSLLLLVLSFAAARRLTPAVADARLAGEGGERHASLHLAAAVTLGAMLLANLAIAATYEPCNYDSLTYHLPRSIYYIGHGNLQHFTTADFRQVFYPFDFNLLQLPVFLYEAPHQAVNFLNLAAWVLTGLAVYRIARLAGSRRNPSLVAAWLVLTCTEFIAQATSTIVDLPSGAALLMAVVFVLRWHHGRRGTDALLAGLGASLSLGTKLTIAFFVPVVGALLAWFLLRLWRSGAAGEYWRGVRAWLPAAVVAGLLTSPFVLYNLRATGLLMTHRMDFTLNKPFTVGCALHTAKTYLVQIFVEPLGRFNFDIDLINSLNLWFSHHVFSDWNEAYVFSQLYTIPPDLNEDHVFFGFAGPFFLLCAFLCLWRDRGLRRPLSWLAFLGLGWFAFYFATNKWSLYNQRYFVPAFGMLAPCAVVAWEDGAARWLRRLGWAVAACALWFATHYLVYNTLRPVPLGPVVRPKSLPVLPHTLAERLAVEPRINVSSYGTNERIFPLLHLGRHQRITSGPQFDPAKYNLFSFWEATRDYIYSNLSYYASYTVVAFPGKPTAGAEFLGTVLNSDDSFDYVGVPANANGKASAPANANICMLVDYNADTNDRIRINGGRIRILGINPADHAHVRVSAVGADQGSVQLLSVAHSDWTYVQVQHPFVRLLIEIVNDADGRILGQGVMPFTARVSGRTTPPPPDPATLFSTELISDDALKNLSVSGLSALEGPYEQWDLPRFRWCKVPTIRITVPPEPGVKRLRVELSARLQVRDEGYLEVRHNGRPVQLYHFAGHTVWQDHTIDLAPTPGDNTIELADLTAAETPDWAEYLKRNPDVRQHLVATNQPLEEGAREHYELHGRAEGRPLPMRLDAGTATVPPNSLYFAYRHLRISGLGDH